MTQSTFYHDGFRDGLNDNDYSLPSHNVYAQEYDNGYEDAKRSLEPLTYDEAAERDDLKTNEWARREIAAHFAGHSAAWREFLNEKED